MTGVLFIVSGPSGAGKSTLVEFALSEFKNLESTVSCTTRQPRGHEKNGKEYYFLSQDKFEEYIQKGLFAEYALVSNYYYGTLNSEALDRICKGVNVILDIDYQGAFLLRDLCKLKGIRIVSIFVRTDNIKELKARLKARMLNDSESIARRIETAKTELSYEARYDYSIVNRDLTTSKDKLRAILQNYIT